MNQSKLVGIGLLAVGLLIGMVACDNDQLVPQQGEMVGSLSNFYKDQKTSMTQTFTINAGQTEMVTGSQGTKITVYANSFGNNGVPATGNIDVELVEAYDKATMLMLGMTTMGRDLFGTPSPLVSGGEFFLEVSQNGQPLELVGTGPQLQTAAFPDADFVQTMEPFLLDTDTPSDSSTWVPVDSNNIMNNCQDSVMISLGQSSYCFQVGDNAQWINCDYFYSWNVPLTNVQVTMPNNYDFTNTRVFLSFDNLNMLTNLNANFSGPSNTFDLGQFYHAPIGEPVHLVIISEQNGSLEYAIQSMTLTSGHSVTINQTDMLPTTVAGLQTQLNNTL